MDDSKEYKESPRFTGRFTLNGQKNKASIIAEDTNDNRSSNNENNTIMSSSRSNRLDTVENISQNIDQLESMFAPNL